MDWSTLLGILAALFGGLNVFQFIFFRATKKKYEAEGDMAHAEAGAAQQSALERRLAAVEKLYEEQGKVVDSMRVDYLKISQEKFQTDKKMVQLELENRALREKVDRMEKELNAYKIVVENRENGKA